MPTSKKIILGIDPGLATTGFAVLNEALKIFIFGIIKTKNKNMAIRLLEIKRGLQKIIKKYKPDLAAVEEIFFYKNLKTAIAVSEARGAILLTLAEAKIPVAEYTPLQVKQTITSYGQADKKQVQKMLQLILKLPALPKPDDAADALAIAITCANHQKKYA